MRYICEKCKTEYAIGMDRPVYACKCGGKLLIDERFYFNMKEYHECSHTISDMQRFIKERNG